MPLDDPAISEVGILITNILQDISSYMKMNDNAVGELKKTTLLLGDDHEVHIVVTADQIKASIKEISTNA